jgi:hypothetical protein
VQKALDQEEPEKGTSETETLEGMPDPEPETEYRALVVGRKSLPRLREVFESFAETGQTDWDAETLERTAYLRLPDVTFVLWALARLPERKIVGFLAAQMQPCAQGREGFVLACHVLPGESLNAKWGLGTALFSWAEALGLPRIMARTKRGNGEGLNEAAAWETLGFTYDSTLMVWERE